MRAITFLLLISIFVLSCTESDSTKAAKEKDNYEAAKESLEDRETKAPADFLTVSGNGRNNILGQTVVKGTITNKATVTSFNDVEVKLDFYSKTGTLLESDRETIYENIAPGQSKNFKTKYFAPKGTDSVALAITGAKVAPKE